MAGTGGTSSSSQEAEFSIRGFGVGSLEVEILCENLGCNEPLELRTEL